MFQHSRHRWRPARARSCGRGRGFTLIEAATTTVIIGVGCLAMLQLLAAGTRANGESGELTTAMNLAGNVRECLTHNGGASKVVAFSDPTTPDNWGVEPGENLDSYDDIDDFDGQTFSPPIDARRGSLGSAYSGWSQTVAVQSLHPDDLKTIIPHLTRPPEQRPISRIIVTIKRADKIVYTQSWLASYAPAN